MLNVRTTANTSLTQPCVYSHVIKEGLLQRQSFNVRASTSKLQRSRNASRREQQHVVEYVKYTCIKKQYLKI